ncbi:MAG: hypothetical protein HRU20_15015 [Pseudomonadales bacterium]|nr:hypothetical protein [Pseudomonadales bacterium]
MNCKGKKTCTLQTVPIIVEDEFIKLALNRRSLFKDQPHGGLIHFRLSSRLINGWHCWVAVYTQPLALGLILSALIKAAESLK